MHGNAALETGLTLYRSMLTTKIKPPCTPASYVFITQSVRHYFSKTAHRFGLCYHVSDPLAALGLALFTVILAHLSCPALDQTCSCPQYVFKHLATLDSEETVILPSGETLFLSFLQ